jgi:hypothetical protein
MKPIPYYSCFITSFLFSVLFSSCSHHKREDLVSNAKTANGEVLFSDPMTGDWTRNWFLDGKKATLEHREDGLFFSGGTVTKSMDPVNYHAHHAVLWTKREFEGDIRISYQWTPLDEDVTGAILLYVQAQGIGEGSYDRDISKWREMRTIPAMDKYFKNMNLISLSIRENVRCKRYPWFDKTGNLYAGGGLIAPMKEYKEKITPGKTYRITLDKRKLMVAFKIIDIATGEATIDHTWDTSKIDKRYEVQRIIKGRIGLRHMSSKQAIYRDFKVEKL